MRAPPHYSNIILCPTTTGLCNCSTIRNCSLSARYMNVWDYIGLWAAHTPKEINCVLPFCFNQLSGPLLAFEKYMTHCNWQDLLPRQKNSHFWSVYRFFVCFVMNNMNIFQNNWRWVPNNKNELEVICRWLKMYNKYEKKMTFRRKDFFPSNTFTQLKS